MAILLFITCTCSPAVSVSFWAMTLLFLAHVRGQMVRDALAARREGAIQKILDPPDERRLYSPEQYRKAQQELALCAESGRAILPSDDDARCAALIAAGRDAHRARQRFETIEGRWWD